MPSTKGYFDLTELAAKYGTSRLPPELRRPINLPLEQVELFTPITSSELAPGEVWPPKGTWSRCERLQNQYKAAKADFRPWFHPDNKLDVAINRIGAYLDDVRAIMLASHPGEAVEPELRKAIRRAIGRASFDFRAHGTAIAVGNAAAGAVNCWPARHAWPFADDSGWSWVIPTVEASIDTNIEGFNALTIYIVSNGVLGGYTVELLSQGQSETCYGTISDNVIKAIDPMPADFYTANRAPFEYGWGTSHVDSLIPVAVTMARRESGADYALDRFEVPHYEISQAGADAGVNWDPTKTYGDKPAVPITAEQYRQAVGTLREHDIVVMGEGKMSGGFKQATLNTSSSLAYLDRLDKAWTQLTGQSMLDSGADEAESGIAFARKQVRLTARVREDHEAIRDMLFEVVGEFDWPFVGTMLGNIDNDGADPAVTAPVLADPDGTLQTDGAVSPGRPRV